MGWLRDGGGIYYLRAVQVRQVTGTPPVGSDKGWFEDRKRTANCLYCYCQVESDQTSLWSFDYQCFIWKNLWLN